MRYLVFSTLFLFCLVSTSAQFAEAKPNKRYDERTKTCRALTSRALEWDTNLWGKGSKLFRNNCQSCHSKDNSSGAPFVHVETYTSDGWNAFFAKRKAVCANDGSWNSFSDDDLQLLNDYLYRNGNWTYDPNDAETCG